MKCERNTTVRKTGVICLFCEGTVDNTGIERWWQQTHQVDSLLHPPFSNFSTRLDNTLIKLLNCSNDSLSFIALSASKESRIALESNFHFSYIFILLVSITPSRRSRLHEPKTYSFTQSMSKENVFLYISVALVVDLKDFPIDFLHVLQTISKYVEPSAGPPNSSCVLSSTSTFIASTH